MRQCWILLALVPLAACASAPKRAVLDASVPLQPVSAEASEASAVEAPWVAAPPAAAEPGFEHARAAAPAAEAWLPSFAAEPTPASQTQSKSQAPVWRKGRALAQGWLGVTSLTGSDRSGGDVPDSGDGDSDLGTMPVIGGGGQWKMAGKGVDFGLEGGVNFAFSTDGGFFATGSNGAVVAVSIDSLLFDLYGGVFLSKYLGDKLRIYGAGGPLMQWATYDQSSSSSIYNGSGSGFGWGYYVRAGLEFLVGNGTMVGFSGRWFDTEIDLSGGLGDWDLSGAQLLFTVTRSF